MTLEELIGRKRELSEQLRRIDEARDAADGQREAKHGDLPWLDKRPEGEGLLLLIGQEWHAAEAAEELTRAALWEVDSELERAGAFG